MKNILAANLTHHASRITHHASPGAELISLVTMLLSLMLSTTAHANVYATNLRLNGGITNFTLSSTGSVSISYLLNEPATAGVKIEINNGATSVRIINLTNGSPGTLRGTNLVVWDGKDGNSNAPSGGAYSVSVTPAAVGYNDWTQISDDANLGNYVWEPRGIAVNKNTNSPYYGRVFVANALPGPNPEANAGDRVGLQKLNADGSPAAEGIFSTGGWKWAGDDFSPWKIEIASDDRVFINDFSAGFVLSFDQAISTNSQRLVLRHDNWPNPSVNFSGPFLTGSGTNAQIWMADANDPGVGIRRWDIAPGGIVASNDLGTTIVESGPNSDLKSFPYDVAVDKDKGIYVPQYRSNSGDPDFRVFRFPAYDESGTPETVADWKIGNGDNTMGGAFGIAVDPTATYVAVAFQGIFSPPFGPWQNSSVRVFYATNGGFVAAPAATQLPPHDYRDVAWDNAGNLYAIDTTNSLWIAFSPPGTNQATTVAVATISVPAQRIPPVLSEPSYAAGEFHCFLTGEPNVIYYIQSSTNLVDWVTLVRTNSLFAKRPITVTATNKISFYRALAGPVSPAPPLLSAPSYATGQFHFTLLGGTNFTYLIQASTDLQNWAPVATNTAATSVRMIDLSAPSPRSFYRALALP